MSRPYSGTLAGVTFEDGRPVKDQDPPADVMRFAGAVNDYARRHGLAIVAGDDGKGDKLVVLEPSDTPEVDSRTIGAGEPVGTRLRDAAVDPRPDDFLPPTNAGEADPHGPLVVSPEIHAAEGVRPVKPGPVAEPDVQERAETADAVAHTDVELEEPRRNAGVDEWRAYAVSKGANPDDANVLGRSALIEQYGAPQS